MINLIRSFDLPLQNIRPQRSFTSLPSTLAIPVYENTFMITQPAVASTNAAGVIEIRAPLDYQTCDDKICYLPVSLPLSWTVTVAPTKRGTPPSGVSG
jgi:hypothetical protein